MQKINFQNLPNTTTPVNASNLNSLQTNVENAINGTVLYNNTNGSNTTIQLSDSLANYYCIDILFGAEDVYNCIRIHDPNEKTIQLIVDVLFGSSNYIKNSKWICSGTSITFSAGNIYSITNEGLGGWSSNATQVYIYKVIGYK